MRLRNRARSTFALVAIGIVAFAAGQGSGQEGENFATPIPPRAVALTLEAEPHSGDGEALAESNDLAQSLSQSYGEVSELEPQETLESVSKALCFAFTLYVANREFREGPGGLWTSFDEFLDRHRLPPLDGKSAREKMAELEIALGKEAGNEAGMERMEELLC